MVHRIEVIIKDLTSQLKGLVPSFQLHSLTLDESTAPHICTEQILILVRGIYKTFKSPKNRCLYNR